MAILFFISTFANEMKEAHRNDVNIERIRWKHFSGHTNTY